MLLHFIALSSNCSILSFMAAGPLWNSPLIVATFPLPLWQHFLHNGRAPCAAGITVVKQ